MEHVNLTLLFQSLIDRNVGVGVGVNSVGVGVGWGEEEERKPRPIGTERAWKLAAPDDWLHAHHHRTDHDRYQVGVHSEELEGKETSISM